MCWLVKCGKCSKTTWNGCGKHVDQIMKNVPKMEQCSCNTKNKPRKSKPDKPDKTK